MTSIMASKNRYIKYIIISAIWLIIWEAASLLIHNSILLTGPLEVLITLLEKCTTLSFWAIVGMSLLRIAIGFTIGSALGLLLGILSYKWALVEDFLKPLMAFLKAAPVASFVVLFLIWWHSDRLSVAVCICVVMPQIYVNFLQGLKNTDPLLLEMAYVYNMHPLNRYHFIYRPAVRPYLEGAVKIAATMAWKSSIAAEVIGTPATTIGEALYMSKIYLDTSGVLAWTLAIIIISVLCERLVLMAYRRYNDWVPSCVAASSQARAANAKLQRAAVNMQGAHENVPSTNEPVVVNGLCKSYESAEGAGANLVLDNYSASFEADSTNYLDWPSGEGKTTLLRILAGITSADSGKISGLEGKSVAMLFQEDRLCEGYSAITNVAMVCGDENAARDILLMLLTDEDIYKPVAELSGGQKRRVAIARMLSVNADLLLVDEPYNGLDAKAREGVRELIEELGNGKIRIISSHISA